MHLDLDDVAATSPLAIEELAKLRAEVGRLLVETDERVDQLNAALERVERLEKALREHDDCAVNAWNLIRKEIAARFWLTEGRGDYRYDDDRYRDEFKHAIEAIKRIADEAVRATDVIVRNAALAARPEERPAESVASVCVCGICPYCIRELRKYRAAQPGEKPAAPAGGK
jgi:hypothetical protein